jgi:hypothetical protein
MLLTYIRPMRGEFMLFAIYECAIVMAMPLAAGCHSCLLAAKELPKTGGS